MPALATVPFFPCVNVVMEIGPAPWSFTSTSIVAFPPVVTDAESASARSADGGAPTSSVTVASLESELKAICELRLQTPSFALY